MNNFKRLQAARQFSTMGAPLRVVKQKVANPNVTPHNPEPRGG